MNFTFVRFEVHTPFQSCCFCPLKFFVDAKFFCRGKFLLGLFSLFSLSQMFFHTRKNVYQLSYLLRNAEPRRCGLFQVKNGGKKQQKCLQRDFFYFCFLILFFTFECCVDGPKVFLPDLGNGSFWVEIRDPEHVDRCS